MKKNLYQLLVILAFGFVFSCENENDALINHELIISSDTLIFNDSEIKTFVLTTKPISICKYQITSHPNWLIVSKDSGTIKNNLENILIQSNFSGFSPGIYEGKIEIMSTYGNKTIYVKGYVKENLQYSLPDSLKISIFGASKEISISNLGNIPLNYSISFSNNYISTTSMFGSVLSGQQNNVLLNVNRANLLSGKYYTKVFININNKLDTINVCIENFKEQKTILLNDIIDAEYSKKKDILVYVSSVPSKIFVYKTSDCSTNSIQLDYIPTCVSVSSDGSKAIVGHDGHITYVDLDNLEVIKTFSVSCDALDIVLGNNKWAYVFPRSDQWEEIRCIKLDTTSDNEVLHTGYSIYAGTKAKLHPSGKYIYGTNNGLSPSDIEKYDIQSGGAKYSYDSQYHGDYPINGDLWFSEDGLRIFTRGKTVLKTSELKSNDMIYNGTISLETTYSYIKWLDHSSIKNNLYVISSSDSWYYGTNRPFIYVYNASNLVFKNRFDLEKYIVPDNNGNGKFYDPEPYYVFSNSSGNNLYVLTKAVGSGLVNEWALQMIKIE